MTNEQSVTWWVQELQAGDEQAAQKLWQRYFQRMAALARQRLGEGARRVSDEHDVAISVFQSLCEGAERGALASVGGRDDLWRLLATITSRKVAQQLRREGRQKRGGGQVRGDSVFSDNDAGFDSMVSPQPSPEFLYELVEEQQGLLASLGDENLRQVALWRFEGWTGEEIAGKMGITRRSVERKLERVRELWKGELNS